MFVIQFDHKFALTCDQSGLEVIPSFLHTGLAVCLSCRNTATLQRPTHKIVELPEFGLLHSQTAVEATD
jgi:hypothetical protein